MADLITDGSLVGFWPLFEASGTPVWKNYSPARANQPSGISFDLHVSTGGGTADDEDWGSPWPGQEIIFNQESGVYVRGLKLQGQGTLRGASNPAPFAKALVHGLGASTNCEQTLAPPVAQSGFTVGVWVYPRSDGWIAAAAAGGFSLVTDSWYPGYARLHALMSQCVTDLGWFIGVSGHLAGATQFGDFALGGPHQLSAYAHIDVSTGTSLKLDTPIESGRYTHLTLSYRYIDGTSNQVAFYKDGRLVASGVTTQDLVLGSTLDDIPLMLGVGSDGAVTTNIVDTTTGWGHLVSGAYAFRRVLHEGEILEMHQRGGLQPDFSLRDNCTTVSLFDTKLVAYYPFMNIGFADVSKNGYALLTDQDEGDRALHYTIAPGPFGGGGALHDATGGAEMLVVPSGGCAALAGGSFSICGFFGPEYGTNDRDGNMCLSWGSVSNATAGGINAISTSTAGLCMSYRIIGTQNRMVLEAYPLGDVTAKHEISSSGTTFVESTVANYAIIYDNETKGLAFYINGALQGSGTLDHSLSDQCTRLVGSGYPLMFLNGISDDVGNVATKGALNTGGVNNWAGPIALFSRPLRADEIRYIAQSGINTTPVWRTRYDTRLVGYWPCDDYQEGDLIVFDKAHAWKDVPGHLVRGDTFTKWERVYDRSFDEGVGVFSPLGTSYVDLYSDGALPPELASYGNLGITSGIFAPMSASYAAGSLGNNASSRNSAANLIARYKAVNEERDLGPQNILGEYIVGFTVTPSGTIPNVPAEAHGTLGNQFWHNSLLLVYGSTYTVSNVNNDGDFRAFLTRADGSGVIIAFTGRDASAVQPLISGTLPYGVPSRVMFHSKFLDPYNAVDNLAGTAPIEISLWINGAKVNTVNMTSDTAKIWSEQVPDSTASDWTLQLGGYGAIDSYPTQISIDGGLGNIYMREIFIMRGVFFDGELEALAASGIQSPDLSGYSSELPTTQVAVTNTYLQGYWRFNGFDGGTSYALSTGGGSGTTDLSSYGNHLDPLAQRVLEKNADSDIPAFMRFMPGPLKNSDLGIRCSGVFLGGNTIAGTEPNMVPPFAVSGAGFNSYASANGFSIGFWLAKRENIDTSTGADVILCYGTLTSSVPNGSQTDTTVSANRGWAIMMDDSEQYKMIMSLGGNMYMDNATNAAQSGQIVCGTTTSTNPLQDLRIFDLYHHGEFYTPALDYWTHYAWVYDYNGDQLRCYVNGTLVDARDIPPFLSPWTNTITRKPQIPATPESRRISFFSPPADPGPWDYRQNTFIDKNSVLTDVFYFSKAITEAELRYIVFNGIDASLPGVIASGTVGGFVYGQDTGSGLIGGYSRGLESLSGLLGGLMYAGYLGSGIIGGYIDADEFGTNIPSGLLAGYLRGQDTASGIYGGYIMGSQNASGILGGFMYGNTLNIASGIVGGFIIGGLQRSFEFDSGFVVEVVAAEDFDAQLEIAKTTAADFDAKLIIFQDETPPGVNIIIPDATVTGLVPPFNQYFVGYASGTQGKTITKTRWTFGDFTPVESVSASGEVYYPVQHYFATSGFYIVKFEAIDSQGMHASATRIVNAASGIDPVIISLSGVPRSGNTGIVVDFTTNIDTKPSDVDISAKLLNFDDGQSTISFNPTHVYTEPGTYKPIWCVRDSRGFIWCDSLEAGNDLLES